MATVDDLIQQLEYYKTIYPEFGKYLVCIDGSDPDDTYPNLKDIKLYINTDIGQVEITHN